MQRCWGYADRYVEVTGLTAGTAFSVANVASSDNPDELLVQHCRRVISLRSFSLVRVGASCSCMVAPASFHQGEPGLRMFVRDTIAVSSGNLTIDFMLFDSVGLFDT